MRDSPFPTFEISDPQLEHDGIRHVTVFSPALGRRADCTLWVPSSERPPRLIILLHGVYGSHWAWTANGGAHVVAAELIRRRSLGPIVLAMPSDGLLGHGSGYVDQRAGNFERWIVDEVPALASLVAGVDATQPIGVVGLSMGGFGALSIGARHGHRVAAVAAMSAITHFEQMRRFVGSLDLYEDLDAPRSVLASILDHRDVLPAIRFDCGSSDLLIAENRELHEALDAEGITHEWHEFEGTHDWAYWRARLPDALAFCVDVLS